MSKKTERLPKYRLHKGTGQAVVTLAKHDFYLGAYGTIESREEYDALIEKWKSINNQVKVEKMLEKLRETINKGNSKSRTKKQAISVLDAAKLYSAWSKTRYSEKEHTNIDAMLKIVLAQYLHERAENIGVSELREIRRLMLARDWSRKYVNAQIGRFKRWYKWLAAQPHIPASVFHTLQVVNGLKAGEEGARETERVLPVSEAVVDTTLAELGEVVAAMVQLQLMTAMRPAELCIMRPCDIDRSEAEWIYTPQKHKTQHYGKSREVFLGAREQEILTPYLLRDSQAYCFSPRESAEKHRAERRENRVTPDSCGNAPGTNCKEEPKRTPGEKFDVASYRQAIHRACDRAFPYIESESVTLAEWREAHRWNPNQLRHTGLTKVRKEFGLEAAQAVAGHSKADTTQIYAERNRELAREVARRIG